MSIGTTGFYLSLRLAIACLLFWTTTPMVAQQAIKCVVCNTPITAEYAMITDAVTSEKQTVCKECVGFGQCCFACNLPVRYSGRDLGDGRFLCSRDSQAAIGSETEAKAIFEKTKDDLDRLFSRFMTFPGTNVDIAIVDQVRLDSLFKVPDREKKCGSVHGITASTETDGKFKHSIEVLSNLRKPHLMAVYAHEYAHTWMQENLSAARKANIDQNSVEAFCELIAFKYLEDKRETAEVQDIRKSEYTKGQIEVLLAADAKHGFNTIVEWVKSGEDSRLELADLDRVKAVTDGTPPTMVTQAFVTYPTVVKPELPETLMLKGIMGTAARPQAIINDRTVGLNETVRVRLAKTNISVRCLEIHQDFVVIQIEGTNERKELTFRARP